jgi:sugar transferase (PEP-CTERM/EpsH1 system associated)
MEPLLFLCHRIPFPPNKGDKIRSYHLLRHLAERYALHLGTFVDDPLDRVHLPLLRTMCASVRTIDIGPLLSRVRAATGLFRRQPLTLPYYRAAALHEWVRDSVRQRKIAKCVVFSSAMAQYVDDEPGLRVVVDFCDVDSAKWKQYAVAKRWPSSALYRRESQLLLDYERAVAQRAAASVFATRSEAATFAQLAPDASARVHVVENGVDSHYFRPDPTRPTPYPAGEVPIVFTGAMNYWPNVDAACWFASKILPAIRAAVPSARFYVVGMNPSPTVAELGRRPAVVITGRVPDVRPYVQHARLVVAPLRVARGIQNKALEAMAMGRPVLVSAAAAAGLSGEPGTDYAVADDAADFVRKAVALMTEGAEAMGRRARERIVAERSWAHNLATFEQLLDERAPVPRPPRTIDRRAEHAR